MLALRFIFEEVIAAESDYEVMQHFIGSPKQPPVQGDH